MFNYTEFTYSIVPAVAKFEIKKTQEVIDLMLETEVKKPKKARVMERPKSDMTEVVDLNASKDSRKTLSDYSSCSANDLVTNLSSSNLEKYEVKEQEHKQDYVKKLVEINSNLIKEGNLFYLMSSL